MRRQMTFLILHIPEKPEDYTIEVKHENSDRVVATWDSFWGLKLKD
jgi:hypothetical protein